MMKIVQISKVRSGMLFRQIDRPELGLCTLIYKSLPQWSHGSVMIVRLIYLTGGGHLHDVMVGTRYNVKILDVEG